MNKLISTLMSTNAGYGITLLRIVTGLTFAAHGAQKLFGWFGGYGLEGVAQWMESIGITPGYLMAALAGNTVGVYLAEEKAGTLTREEAQAKAKQAQKAGA